MVVLKALHTSSGFPKTPIQPLCKLLSYSLILELANIQCRLGSCHSSGFEVQLQSFYNKLVVGNEELRTLVDPADLDHPPASIIEHMVNLLCHTSVGIPSPAMSLWMLNP